MEAFFAWLDKHLIEFLGLIAIPIWLTYRQRQQEKDKQAAELRRKEAVEAERRQHEAIASAAKQAYDSGVEATLADQQRAATKAEHERIDKLWGEVRRQTTRYEIDREFMLRKGVIPAGSQVGEDGRGLKNPMLEGKLTAEEEEAFRDLGEDPRRR